MVIRKKIIPIVTDFRLKRNIASQKSVKKMSRFLGKKNGQTRPTKSTLDWRTSQKVCKKLSKLLRYLRKVHEKLLLFPKTRKLNYKAKGAPTITVIGALESIKRSWRHWKKKRPIIMRFSILAPEGFLPKVTLLILKEIQRLWFTMALHIGMKLSANLAEAHSERFLKLLIIRKSSLLL